jgi:hypothetical protein
MPPKETYFPFKDSAGRQGNYRLRLFDTNRKVVVIATDLDEGPSVTNVASELATQVIQHFTIDPERLVWVEHYPREDTRAEAGKAVGEEYDLVMFEWNGEQFQYPAWSYADRLIVEALIGETLDEGGVA